MKIAHSSQLEMSDIFIGDCLYLDSRKLKECLNYLIANNIKNVCINSECKFKAKNLSFLKTFGKHITGIMIETEIEDISELSNHTHLEAIFINEKVNQDLDLSVFNNLKYCQVTFNDKIKNLDNCYNLEHLTIYNYNQNDLSIIGDLNKLRYLEISNSRKLESLNGIENCSQLNRVELFYLPKLTDISKIHLLNNLKRFLVINCKKIDNSEIEKLIHLYFFAFNGKIYSSPSEWS
jgi:hypothetical protein